MARPRHLLPLLAIACGLSATRCDCSGPIVERVVYVPRLVGPGDAPHRSGEVLVRFNPTTSREEVEAIVSEWGGTLADAPEADASDANAAIFLVGTYRVLLPPGMSVEEAMGLLTVEPAVDYVEPNYVYKLSATPDDERLHLLWGFQKIGASTAWDTTSGSPDVVVGVIDSGIDLDHPDLAANLWTNPGETPGDGVDNDGNGYTDDVYGWDFCNNDADPDDDNSHGTHCAGTVAAVGDNTIGIAGLAWRSRVMAVKFACADGEGTADAAANAIRYAADMGADLTSNSWNGAADSDTLRNAIQYAANRGMLFVASAGDDSSNNDVHPDYPASFAIDAIVAVAATDDEDELDDDSNFGASSVDLAAPGKDVYSTDLGGVWDYKAGTSTAAPHVAGAAALLLAKDPTLGWDDLRDALLDSVDTVATLNGKVATNGRLNVARALEEVIVPPDPPTGLTAESDGASGILVSWQASTDETVTGYRVYLRTDAGGPLPAVNVAGRLTAETSFSELPDGDAHVAVSAVGLAGEGARSTEVTVEVDDETAPARILDLTVTADRGAELFASSVDVSSEFGSAWQGEHLVDSDPDTLWAARPASDPETETVVLDLGAVVEVGQITLRPAAPFLDLFPRDFELSVGQTTAALQVVAREIAHPAPSDEAWQAWHFVPLHARFVELKVTGPAPHASGLSYVVLADISVFAPAADPAALLASWTAVGDDGLEGTASEYDLRTSLILTEGNFDLSHRVIIDPPAASGTPEQRRITGLRAGAIWSVALRAIDDADPLNKGPISPIRSVRTGAYPPGDVEGLAVSAPSAGVFELRFTAPADDGHSVSSGDVDHYEVRWHDVAIDHTTWADVRTVAGLPAPRSPGSAEVLVLNGLAPAARHHFRVAAVDDDGVRGPWSPNVALDEGSEPDITAPADVGELTAVFRASPALPLALVPADDVTLADVLDGNAATGWMEQVNPGVPTRLSFDYGEPALPLSRVRLLPHRLYAGDFPIDLEVLAVDPADGQEKVLATREDLLPTPGVWLDIDFPPKAATGFTVSVTQAMQRFGVTAIAFAELEAFYALHGGVAALVTWAAPGDDGDVGTATTYDLRMGGCPLVGMAAFNNATPVPGLAAPSPAGSLESHVVTDLEEGSTVCFLLRTADEVPNWSGLSNMAQLGVPSVPPDAVDDLRVVAAGRNSLTVRFTAPGDDGDQGEVVEYVLHTYADGELNAETFVLGTRAPTGDPQEAGRTEEVVINNLQHETRYEIALYAKDDSGATSGLSNVAVGTTLDGTPPPAVEDLAAVPGDALGTVDLSWTAPGDLGPNGKAVRYEVRYQTNAFGPGQFWNGQPADVGGALPLAAGEDEARTISGLTHERHYWFALVTIDELDNRSAVSNIVTVATTGIPPGRIMNLQLVVASRQPDSLILNWTAPGDDDNVGTATSYDLRRSDQPIDEDNFNDALQVATPGPRSPGTLESVLVEGLEEATIYHFAIKAVDDFGLTSPVSADLETQTLDVTPPLRVIDLEAEPLELGGIPIDITIDSRSGAYSAQTEATNLLDGNGESMWFSPATPDPDPAWVIFDLGGEHLVDRVRLQAALLHVDLFPEDFLIELELLDGSWRRVIDEQDTEPPADGWVDRPFGGRYATRVRVTAVHGMNTGMAHTVVLSQVEIYEADLGSVSAALLWTAPHDNDPTGGASSYDLRMSTSPITVDNFDAADVVPTDAPDTGGRPDSCQVDNLQYETTYYFALISEDADGNRGPMSNVAVMTTKGRSPDTVIDLEADEIGRDWVEVEWTAPGNDANQGRATSYDVRYTRALLNPGSWDLADWATGEPAPSPAGATERFRVEGLRVSTEYRIALTATDTAGNVSALSNLAIFRTLDPPERVPPGAVADLSATTHPVNVATLNLEWTAPGDDGDVGSAVSYEIRWSTEEITAANFASATEVDDPPVPTFAGDPETLTLAGLPHEALIYVALRSTDDEDNVSAISNVASARTMAFPPAQIDDLGAVPQPGGVDLSWTSVGDDGLVGPASSYEVFVETTWFSKWTVAQREPRDDAPLPADVADEDELMQIRDLDNDTTYWVAVRALDDEDNAGELSTVLEFTTPDVVAPGAFSDLTAETGPTPGTLRITFVGPGDDGAVGVPTAYQVRFDTSAFAPGGFVGAQAYAGAPVVPAAGGVPASRVLTNLPHECEVWVALLAVDNAGLEGPVSQVVSALTMQVAPGRVTNLSGTAIAADRVRLSWTAPGDDGATGTATAYELRRHSTVITVGNWDATVEVLGVPAPAEGGSAEEFEVGGLEHGTTYYFALRARDELVNWGTMSNCAEVSTTDVTDPDRVDDLVVETPAGYRSLSLTWTAVGDDGDQGRAARVRVYYAPTPFPGVGGATEVAGPPTLDPGAQQRFLLTGLADETEYDVVVVTEDEDGNQGPQSDVVTAWTKALAPDPIVDLAVVADGGDALVLTWSAPADDAGDPDSGPVTSYEIAVGTSVFMAAQFDLQDIRVGPAPLAPTEQQQHRLDGLDNDIDYWVAVRGVDERGATGRVIRVLTASTTDELPPGQVVSLEAHSPRQGGDALPVHAVAASAILSAEWEAEAAVDGDLQSAWATPPGQGDGAWLEVDLPTPMRVGGVRMYAGDWPARFPADFHVEVDGQRVAADANYTTVADQWVLVEFLPVTARSVKLVVDRAAGGGVRYVIVNEFEVLPADDPPDSIRLTWVAPGDDGQQGKADSYEIRRAAAPIVTTDDFDAATVVTAPAPGPAGAPQAVWVSELEEETTYHFALRAIDDTGLVSELSNAVSAATAGIPPAAILNLTAVADGAEGAVLSWTAPGANEDVGQAASYDVRFRPFGLSTATWGGAHSFDDVPAPEVANTPEELTVDDLLPATLYAFAIQTTDGPGHVSPMSNVAYALTDPAPDEVEPGAINDLVARLAAGTGLPLAVRSVMASGSQTPDHPATAATDGDLNTAWASLASDGPGVVEYPEFLEVTLATLTAVDRITMRPHPAFVDLFPSDFVLRSWDGVNNPELVTKSGFVAEEDVEVDLPLPSAQAVSTIRLEAQRRFRDPHYLVVVAELHAYEAAAEGTVTLIFTAPGDDGDVGTADHYLLGQAGAAITAGTWDQARQAVSPAHQQVVQAMTPAPAGVVQALTLSGLETGSYFFALRAVDDADHMGPLGNSPGVDVE